jgi:hypothetical protein
MTTPALTGNAQPIGLPGGRAGYFQPIRPQLMKMETPGFPLSPNVITAVQAGTAVVNYGTMVGQDKNDPALAFKIVDIAAATPSSDHRVKPADCVRGSILPVFNTSFDLTMLSSGTVPVVYHSEFDAETDQLDPAYVAPVVNDRLTVSNNGRLIASTTGADIFVGSVIRTVGQIAGAPGSNSSLVIQVRFRGIALVPNTIAGALI